MSLRRVQAPHLGRPVVLGRRRPVARCPRLTLRHYADVSTPPTCDYGPKAASSLVDVYLNDQLGDCVIAAGYHLVGVATGNATGTPFVATDAQITADYSAIGGYVPGQPSTDQGCDEQTALNYWTSRGFADGSQLCGWLAVDGTDKKTVQTALYLFENLFFGVELPDAWISPFPSADGFTWDVAGAADPQNGHAFLGYGYDDKGVTIDTWGLRGTVTYAAIAQYATMAGAGELYVLLTPDLVAKGQSRAPNGFDWSSLVADFDALGGKVPAPSPPAVTLDQASAWAAQGIASGGFLMTRSQATAAAKRGLTASWPK